MMAKFIMDLHILAFIQALTFLTVLSEYYSRKDIQLDKSSKESATKFDNVPSAIACVQKCKFRKSQTHYRNGKCYCFRKGNDSQQLETYYQSIELDGQYKESNSNSKCSKSSIKRNCTEWLLAGSTSDGQYVIKPGNTVYTVFCDMNTDGGGWIKFQNRFDGSVNFTRSWNEYKNGFGNLSTEFWLGNEIVHQLTTLGMNQLRISASDFQDNKIFAKFSGFALQSEQFGFNLTYTTCVAGSCNSVIFYNSQNFSTYDRDKDGYPPYDIHTCANSFKSGWWFDKCFKTNLNGQYRKLGETFPQSHGIHWNPWKNHYVSLKSTQMMLR